MKHPHGKPDKLPGWFWTLLLLAAVLPAAANAAAAETLNHCKECHTTPARLVPAVMEAQQAVLGLPSGSTLTAGEG